MSTQDTAQTGAATPCSLPITLRLTAEEIDKAQILARRDHRTRAAFIRVMFLRGLAAYEKELQSATV
ncbi:hypothetical protein [Herbaspirillum rubrisubalbicans]|uniref:hypothetical protein n=1 Tax=Herbaspirillum rubrisubalbicans TaxID=80842 RepID=UPI0012E34891|nr:hypothetical protein [Herbaspirillum rubrisubalbicans]